MSPDEKTIRKKKSPPDDRPAKPRRVKATEESPIPEPPPPATEAIPPISEELIFREYALIALDRDTKTPDRMRALEWLYEYLTSRQKDDAVIVRLETLLASLPGGETGSPGNEPEEP